MNIRYPMLFTDVRIMNGYECLSSTLSSGLLGVHAGTRSFRFVRQQGPQGTQHKASHIARYRPGCSHSDSESRGKLM